MPTMTSANQPQPSHQHLPIMASTIPANHLLSQNMSQFQTATAQSHLPVPSIGEIQIANGSKRRDLNLKYSGRTTKLTAWNEVADTVGGCHLQAGKMYHIKSVVPTNDFQDCRCYNASPSTNFELLDDRVEKTGIIDGVVESVSFESNIIEVQDEYCNIPKTMLMTVFPSGIFVNNTNIPAKRRREEVIEM
ncbi:unnamed protein product [Mytilus coruscus]|uniref:Uncharacterized protein n=1 Tax=Mytilus coruscus TaxID=42192 RepID=A0A6J8CIC4_MYTCO|nr:unnamed protein product [Mytilus coruscus]